jgi:5S rRNA maturation endonuclease (ribonuclease M5)
MTIKELYQAARVIPDELKFHNKYTWLAHHNVIEARYLDINDTFRLVTPINDYIKKFDAVLLIPNFVNGWMVDLVIKPLYTKESMLTFDFKHLPFGIGELRSDFKYGNPLYLVEGIADWAALKLIKPDLDVIAIRSNSIPKDMYTLYASLTNKIILIPDSDNAGHSQIKNIKNNFSKLNTDLYCVEQFSTMKDTGELIDLLMKFEKTSDTNIKDMIDITKEYFLENFKNF